MRTINAQELQRKMDGGDNFLLVNTLPADDYPQTKIEGSVNIPQDKADFVQQVENRLGNMTDEVIVYCASEQCNSSEKAAEKLEQAGFENVADFSAGAEGWRKVEQTAGTSA